MTCRPIFTPSGKIAETTTIIVNTLNPNRKIFRGVKTIFDIEPAKIHFLLKKLQKNGNFAAPKIES